MRNWNAKLWVACLGATLVAAIAVNPAIAAKSAATVKVALLDMSSVSGMGMMGRGMMRPGAMGPGMMGPGVMGGRMLTHGMTAIRLDQSTVKAGPIHFDVTNWSQCIVHEVLVVSVDNPWTPLPYDYSKGKVPEDQVKVLGEVADLSPNASGTLSLTLPPRSYLLICNVAGHYAAGMTAPLNVSP